MLLIDNVTLLTPREQIAPARLLLEKGRIRAFGPRPLVNAPANCPTLDAADLILTPGWIDVQINGGFGHDFTANPATLWEVARHLPRYGVTTFLPTFVTSPLETLAQAREVWRAGAPEGFRGADPLGLHIEGPFLNPARKGAHNPAYLRLPELAAVKDWTPANGVRLVTLAPELPGAAEVIHHLVAAGVRVSAGHSAASYEEALRAFGQGVTYGTHLFNGMNPLEHRSPGLVGALLSSPQVWVGLIVDGIHVHPAVVRVVWLAKGSQRLTLVTDAIAALGMSPGRYVLGDFEVVVDETSVRLANNSTLAGSILSLDTALRNLMAFTGCSLQEALITVTESPAAMLGLNDRGHIAAGYRADLVFLSPKHEVVMTMVGGQVLYGEQAFAERLKGSYPVEVAA